MRLLPALARALLVSNTTLPAVSSAAAAAAAVVVHHTSVLWRCGVSAIVLSEGLVGGALTTVTFAYMMALVRPGSATTASSAGTLYTLLATVEVCGKMLPSMVSGVLADRGGYGAVFWMGMPVTLASTLVVARVVRCHVGDGRFDAAVRCDAARTVALSPSEEAKTK